MILSDNEILRRLGTLFPGRVEELQERVQPCSVDLRVAGPLMRVETPNCADVPLRPGESELREVPLIDGQWILRPGILYLISTHERIEVPNDLLARLDGRSSWARIGLRVHATAGFLDPGFKGEITLELDVVGPPVALRPGDSICQVSFTQLTEQSARPYGSRTDSRYHNQVGVTASRKR